MYDTLAIYPYVRLLRAMVTDGKWHPQTHHLFEPSDGLMVSPLWNNSRVESISNTRLANMTCQNPAKIIKRNNLDAEIVQQKLIHPRILWYVDQFFDV